MTEQESKNLIKETFESDFNRERFKRFTANLLTDFQEASILTSEQYIKDAYKPYVYSYEVIAKFADSEKRTLDVLITYLKTESTFTARTRQRNFALDYLKSKNRDGVLIAYVHENKKDWRFSFVKLENDVVKGEDGRVKDISSFTAAKRSSFLVGSNENSYTAKKQFLPIIQKEDQPKFEDIEEAFSVETVTKEFFEKYRELFHDVHDALEAEIKGKPQLKEEFNEKEVSTVDFAKKLLGQMVFLYFLQKKGWFGVKPNEDWGTGPKNFLRELFRAKDRYGNNFFNDVLEPLFYEALAQDKRENEIYPRLNNCRMPFLNGGLFEPMRGYSWETTDIFLPDELFSNSNKTKEGDIGDGILDIFDRYNFTVNESDPLEKEVAVDPEMLGKVFENLLDIKDRKSKGSFYTPREIVHYMCQESLIYYLEIELGGDVLREDIKELILNGETIIQNDFVTLEKKKNKEEKGYKYTGTYELKLPKSIRENARRIDDLLKDVKICDPAVGSGAFPLGMINEIVGARQVLQVYLRDMLSISDLKYHAITNSIFGVDIDPGAVDIARLRLWLSLVVEQNIPEPLPNLEHKIMQGNSLVSEYEGIKIFNKDLLYSREKGPFQFSINFGSPIERKIDGFQDQIRQYLKESKKDKKKEIKMKIDFLRWELIEETLKEQGKLGDFEEIRILRQKNVRPFFIWELEFSEVFKEKGGFDIVIGNPPYFSISKIKNKKEREAIKRENYQVFSNSTDIYCLFYEKAISLVRENDGLVTFITSNKWMKATYGEALRKLLITKNPIAIIDLGPGVFKSATVDTSILILRKQIRKDNSSLIASRVLKYAGDNFREAILETLTRIDVPDGVPWLVLSDIERIIMKKIQKIGSPLNNHDIKINRGILTGYNNAFFIDKRIRDKLIAKDEKSEEIILPVLRGRDIRRHGYKWEGLYILLTGYDIDIPTKYPAVFEHLQEHKIKLEKRQDKGLNWWNLRACTYYEDLKKKKIIYPETASTNNCFFDKEGFTLDKTAFFITGSDIEFLYGVIFSNPFTYFYKTFGSGTDLSHSGFQYNKHALLEMNLPMRKDVNDKMYSRIVSLVSDLYTKEFLRGDIQKEIDNLVYQIYQITDEERNFIDKFNPS